MANQLVVTGADELRLTFAQMQAEFGPQRTGNGLVTAVRRAMKPALASAKALAPKDTGALAQLLRLEARLPSRKDRRSKYIAENDVVIGLVTTPPAKKLGAMTPKGHKIKLGRRQVFVKSDARAIAQEFGTARHAAQPFLRPAIEAQKDTIIRSLANELATVLQKYRKKGA